MRFAKIIDRDEDMILVSDIFGKTWIGEEPERLSRLGNYRNLMQRKWKTATDPVGCYVLMVCLEYGMKDGFVFNGAFPTGYYENAFRVTPEGKMEYGHSFLEFFLLSEARDMVHFYSIT